MGDKVQIYIVEDEAITRATLKSNLLSMGYEVVGMADEAEKAWEEIQELSIDLAILDINLIGDKDGIWLAEQINKKGGLPYIFLTAYSDKETVERAVKSKPNGYLIKPFEEMDIYSAIEIGLDNFAQRNSTNTNLESDVKNIVIKDSIFIKDEHMLVKLNINDIHYVKSDGNYIEVNLASKKHLIRNKLSDFLMFLPDNSFMKIHQRFLVNTSKIESIGYGFVMIDGSEIPVSKSYREELLERFTTL